MNLEIWEIILNFKVLFVYFLLFLLFLRFKIELKKLYNNTICKESKLKFINEKLKKQTLCFDIYVVVVFFVVFVTLFFFSMQKEK